MILDFSPEEQSLLAANDEVAAAVAANAADCDAKRRPPREAWATYAGSGLKGMLVPKAQGGHGIRAVVMARMSEVLGRSDPMAAITFVPQEYCMAAVAKFGHHPWHQEMLATLMAGEKLTGFLLTEPNAGSDASAITTLATRTDSGWTLDGAKAWVTNAPYIDEFFVFVQTEAGSGAEGIAGFLVPREAPGVSISQPYDMLGGHTGTICDVTFEGVELAAERLVVPPGEGLRAALSAIDLARINVSALCCGALETGIDTALEYTTTRHAFGQAIANFQGLQWQMAEASTHLHAARLMVYDAAAVIDRDGRAPVEAAHVKKFATRIALAGLDTCMAQLGANGLKHDTPLPRLFANAKIAQSLDGTAEIQNIVIARSLLKPYADRLSG